MESPSELLEKILTERRANWIQEQLESFIKKGNLPNDDSWKKLYQEPPSADKTLLPAIPKEWVWSTISQLGELNRGKSKHRPRNDPVLYGGSYPFIQTGDVRAADGVLINYTQSYSEKGLAQSRLWPKGTLCITIAANIAETAILGFDACFPDSIVGFISQGKLVSTEYVEFFFRTAKKDLDRYAPATAQKNINLEILRHVAIPLMAVAEQEYLALIVREKLDATNRTENTIDLKIESSAALKASILEKAFSGELVRNNSKQDVRELIDKIKAEKKMLKSERLNRTDIKVKKVTSIRRPLLVVLNELNASLTPEELMQEAGFSLDDIEDFYIELASLSDKIETIAPRIELLKSWPYEKEASFRLKLKD